MLERQLKYSFDRHKPITIIYLKGMEISQRNIQVLKIEKDFIRAIDLGKRAIRTFKKDNILSAMDVSYNNKNIRDEEFEFRRY